MAESPSPADFPDGTKTSVRPVWIPTRAAARARLAAFLPLAGGAYARQRGFDLGSEHHGESVSLLSPWLRHRLLTEPEVIEAALDHHGLEAAEKFVQEVCWRSYWKGWLERRPPVWTDYRTRVREQMRSLDADPGLRERWESATAGKTGIDCFDHWARELVTTGYLHNHARMWFASIWLFTLELPWALGADFFLRHLLDGDAASNTLSWRWVAGLQTRGKIYLARPDNIAHYTAGRFRPSARLAVEAEPPAAPPLPEPRPLPEQHDWDRSAATGLLLTEDDLSPEYLGKPGAPLRTVLAFKATVQRSPLPVATSVHAFADGALRDALTRMAPCAESVGPVCEGPGAIDSLVERARAAGLRQLVTPYIPCGPTADALAPLRTRLAAADIDLVAVMRPWDTLAWTHAPRGFFAFWKRIRPRLGCASSPPGAVARPDPAATVRR
ncbi:MAG: FAD-binding domain-containing protein [Candidatus Competibacterales bacterium]|nr:FAD-binding domain-containing protein [Candidatus Competibacterales bacterium]